MPTGRLQSVLRRVRHLVSARPSEELSDRHLLERFANDQEEAAFGRLVDRHGPMVLGVCRRVLQDAHAAEDAFQATFLVLARRAGSVGWHDSIANWLFGVAQRIAGKARAQALRRQGRERQAEAMADATSAFWDDREAGPELGRREDDPLARSIQRELEVMVDQELTGLPGKYRSPLVLCYLEGKTNEEAARELRWPTGTVKTRLAHGRELLRGRLAQRGLALSAGLFGMALAETTAGAAVTPALARSTVEASVLFASSPAAAAAVSPRAAAWTNEMLKSLTVAKLRISAALLLVFGLAGTGALLLAAQATPGSPAARTPEPLTAPVGGLVADLGPEPRLLLQAPTRRDTIQLLHQFPLGSVSFAPDGQSLAVAGKDSRIFLWDATTGRVRRRLPIMINEWFKIAFSPDGKTLAAGSCCGKFQFHLLDVATGEIRQELKGHAHAVTFVAYSADGGVLVSGSRDGTIGVWDPADGTLRHKHKWSAAGELHMALGLDGRSYVWGATGKSQLRLRDTATGKEIHRFQGPPDAFTALAFAPDGLTLASGSPDGAVCLWDVARGEVKGRLPSMNGPVSALAFSADGRSLAVAGEKAAVYLWDLETDSEARRLDGDQGGVVSLAFSSNGRTLATAGADQSVLLWDLADLDRPERGK